MSIATTFELLESQATYAGTIPDLPFADRPASVDEALSLNREYRKAHDLYYDLLSSLIFYFKGFVKAHEQDQKAERYPKPNNGNGFAKLDGRFLPPPANGQRKGFSPDRTVTPLLENLLAGTYSKHQLDRLSQKIAEFEHQLDSAITAEQLERLAVEMAKWADREVESIISALNGLARAIPPKSPQSQNEFYSQQRKQAIQIQKSLSKLKAANPQELSNRAKAVVR